jgi:hypothetical protein
MTSRGTRKRAAPVDTDSDIENQEPLPGPSKAKKPRRSHSTIVQATSSTGNLAEFKEIMVQGEKRRNENQKEMVETLRESTRVYQNTSERYLEVIRELLKKD